MPSAARSIASHALVALALSGCAYRSSGEVEAAETVYIRTDTDDTTVVAPRTRVAATIDDTVRIEAAHGVDIWTGASVDVVSAATTAIHETRHEIQAGASYTRGTASVGGSYRYSTEPDYRSHGGVLRGAIDFAQKNTTLALALFGSRDTVGRAHDPGFVEPQSSVGGRITYTQVLHPRAIGELSWETTRVGGFQSSPYRWVAIGGDGLCGGDAPYCVPEHEPDERYRHAGTALGRFAGPAGLSFGAKYRLYVDSWGVRSHTIEPDLAWGVAPGGVLSLRYRYYTQGEADFYRPRYFDLDGSGGYVTRDRKLSALYTHSASLGYAHDVALASATLSLGLLATGTRSHYLAFVGLEHVYALEATALLGVRFDVGCRTAAECGERETRSVAPTEPPRGSGPHELTQNP